MDIWSPRVWIEDKRVRDELVRRVSTTRPADKVVGTAPDATVILIVVAGWSRFACGVRSTGSCCDLHRRLALAESRVYAELS